MRREIIDSMEIAEPTELLVFGKWVASHVEDGNNVSLRYAKLWTGALSMDERRKFVAMVERLAKAAGAIKPAQNAKIAKFSERLGLTTQL